MRILHLDSGRSLRGGQWQALELMEGLNRRGHRGRLLARRGSTLEVEAARRGLEVRSLTISALVKEVRSADLIHCHDARTHTWAAVAGLHPLVVARRVAFPVKKSLLSKWKYARADHYIAVSRYVASQLKEAGIPEDRISVVYDGFRLRSATDQSGPAGDRIVSPASDDPRKGTGLAREAAAGFDLHFSTNLEEDLSRARVFLYLTEEEGLGSACLLAMAMGVPVIASRVGGLPEIVAHGETGLLVENDATAVRAAIRQLLDDPALCARLGAEGRQRAFDRFTADHMVDGTLAVYGRLA